MSDRLLLVLIGAAWFALQWYIMTAIANGAV